MTEAFSRLRVSAGENDEERGYAQLLQALQAHDGVLRTHLELEEDLVVPLLLELSPDEFDFY